VQVSVAIK